MKITSFLSTATTAALLVMQASAQSTSIGAPAAGSDVTRGQNITVEVDKPNSLTGSDDVAVVIALRSCASLPDGSCATFDVSEALGTILYQGPYSPAYQNVSGQGWKPPYQNFSVAIPSSFATGEAALSVTHLVLIGAGPYPDLGITNVTVNVV